MGRPPLSIDITQKDQNELAGLLSSGVQQVRVVLRALALLQLAQGVSAPRISTTLRLRSQAIRKVGHRYEKAAGKGRSTRGHGPERRRCWTTRQKQRCRFRFKGSK